MFILFGESIREKVEKLGSRDCTVCGAQRMFCRVEETNYFTIYGFCLLPIEKIANYARCEHCQTAYLESDLSTPSYIPMLQLTVGYLLLGYGQQNNDRVAMEIHHKVTKIDLDATRYKECLRNLSAGNDDYFEILQDAAPGINISGKRAIVVTAFLTTHLCCEIQYEDKLRINLIGNALGVSMEFVADIISEVRAQGYFGIRRLVDGAQKVNY